VVSITIVVSGDSMSTLLRNRQSRESAEIQTGQLHPIMGTPLLVPVPKKVI
jgi:hypothetical protein